MGTRFSLSVRLAVCAACFTFAAYGGVLSLSELGVNVAGGSIVHSNSSTSWGGLFPTQTATSGGVTWDYGDINSSGIFLLPSSNYIVGLTDSEFQCATPGGCGALGITFTLYGVALSSLPASGDLIIGLNGSTTNAGPLQALYSVSDSPSAALPLFDSTGIIPLPLTAGAFSASNAGTPVLFNCPSCSTSGALVNITVFLEIDPTAGTFSDGDTVTLPSSFTVTVVNTTTPEPASGVVAGLGLAALGAWRRVRASARERDRS
jgi:MYXO-CTERM domain-containing protein